MPDLPETVLQFGAGRFLRGLDGNEITRAFTVGDDAANGEVAVEQRHAVTHLKVFLLRDVEGFSIAETADMLGISEPAVKTRFATLGAEAMTFTPVEFGAFMTSETGRWGDVVKAAGLKPE